MDEEDDPLDTIYERIQRGVEELATGEVKVIDEEEIFNALKNNKEMVKRVFPQQVQGCGYLMGAHPKIGNR